MTFGVPRKSLNRHLNGVLKKPGSLGRFKPVLSEQCEEALVQHAIDLQQTIFGLVPEDRSKLAFDVAGKSHLKHPFKNKRAGKFWLESFLK